MIPTYRKVWLINGTGKRADRDGFWIEWAGHDGKRSKRRFPTKAMADIARREVERAINGWMHPKAAARWDIAKTRFESSRDHVTHSYRKELFASIAALEAFAKPTFAGSITSDIAARFLNSVTEPTRRAKHFRHLRVFFLWLAMEGYVASNPLETYTPPKMVRKLPRVPRADDWLRLLERVSDERIELDDPQGWYLLILLAAVTGFRQQTLLRVRLRDIDLAGPEQTAVITLVESKTKREEFRVVPATVAALINRRIFEMPDGQERLFGWDRWQRKAWDRLKRASTFKFSFHDLRRAAGTDWSIARLESHGAEHLGHSSSAVFAAHYGDRLRLAVATAQAIRLPELPPMPAYALGARLTRGRLPNRNGASSQSENGA